MQKNIWKWQKQVKNQPNFNHLDVGCLRKALNHADEHTGENQHHGQVHRKARFKEEGFEVVGDVADYVEEYRRRVDCCDHTQELPSQPNIDCKANCYVLNKFFCYLYL